MTQPAPRECQLCTNPVRGDVTICYWCTRSESETNNALEGGYWRWRGWTATWIPTNPTRFQDERELVWTDTMLRNAHAAFKRGLRDDHTVAGHREWDRRYRAAKRAERSRNTQENPNNRSEAAFCAAERAS